jgi:hypothetical protein
VRRASRVSQDTSLFKLSRMRHVRARICRFASAGQRPLVVDVTGHKGTMDGAIVEFGKMVRVELQWWVK